MHSNHCTPVHGRVEKYNAKLSFYACGPATTTTKKNEKVLGTKKKLTQPLLLLRYLNYLWTVRHKILAINLNLKMGRRSCFFLAWEIYFFFRGFVLCTLFFSLFNMCHCQSAVFCLSISWLLSPSLSRRMTIKFNAIAQIMQKVSLMRCPMFRVSI